MQDDERNKKRGIAAIIVGALELSKPCSRRRARSRFVGALQTWFQGSSWLLANLRANQPPPASGSSERGRDRLNQSAIAVAQRNKGRCLAWHLLGRFFHSMSRLALIHPYSPLLTSRSRLAWPTKEPQAQPDRELAGMEPTRLEHRRTVSGDVWTWDLFFFPSPSRIVGGLRVAVTWMAT